MDMKKEDFISLITSHIKWEKEIEEASDSLGIDLFESKIITHCDELFEGIIKHNFSEDSELIIWWLYECREGKRDEAYVLVDNVKVSCSTIEELWELVNSEDSMKEKITF